MNAIPDDEVLNKEPGSLTPGEIFWRNHQKWLLQCGYMLRPRFRPEWVPTWEKEQIEGKKAKKWYEYEDGVLTWSIQVMDAIRVSDSSNVALKVISKSIQPYEADIGTLFSTEPFASDPRNHCVPLIEILQVPDVSDEIILVMPQLRKYDSPRFDTIGEAVSCFKQLFEGLQFMHEHHVAHRDISILNYMFDASLLYPDGFHPAKPDMSRDYKHDAKYYTRTQRKHRYYLIDFGLSRQYNPEDGPPLELPIRGGDKSVPEYQNYDVPSDPFAIDIYCAGNLIRRTFLRTKHGFEFMENLIADMVQNNPEKRPNINEVVERFNGICNSLSSWKLRSRIIHRKDSSFFGFFRFFGHWTRRTTFVVRRIPPIPT